MRTDKMDHWVRQFLGNTGEVSYEEARGALTEIERNMSAGLFPTTGGAVSLLAKEDVEEIYRSNRGLFPKFRPTIPDAGGRRAKTLSEWYVAAIEQAIIYCRDPRTLEDIVFPIVLGPLRPFSLRHTAAMDGFLHTYHFSGIDWRRIRGYAASRHAGATPDVGEAPYWLTNAPEPLSVLAFTDQNTRSVQHLY